MTINDLESFMKPGRAYNIYRICQVTKLTSPEVRKLINEATKAGLIESPRSKYGKLYILRFPEHSGPVVPKSQPFVYDSGELQHSHTQWNQFRALCEATRAPARPGQIVRQGLLSPAVIEGKPANDLRA